jgi:hypothetical protein
MAHLYPRRRNSRAAVGIRLILCLGFPLRQRLLHHLKSFGDLGLKLLETRRQQRGFRIDHHIHPRGWPRFLQPDRLAEPAFHSISLDGAAEYLPDCEAHPEIRGFTCGKTLALPPQVKNRHVRSKIASSLLIDAIKLRMLQYPPALRKFFLRVLRGEVVQNRLQAISSRLRASRGLRTSIFLKPKR